MANLGLAPILFGSHVSGVSLPSEITVDAADFDGTNDHIGRGATLNGVSSGKTGILSFWFRLDGGDGSFCYVLYGGAGGPYFYVAKFSDNTIKITGTNPTGLPRLNINTTSAYTAGATWYHLLASWDVENSEASLYINDVDDLTTISLSNDTLYYGASSWRVGSFSTDTLKFNGAMAEFYFAPGQYLDFSEEANRRQFISGGGKPVDLGADGSGPTGTAPAIYLHLDDSEDADNFANNLGSGGAFTLTGDLDTASSSPSD